MELLLISSSVNFGDSIGNFLALRLLASNINSFFLGFSFSLMSCIHLPIWPMLFARCSRTGPSAAEMTLLEATACRQQNHGKVTVIGGLVDLSAACSRCINVVQVGNFVVAIV